MRARNWLEAIIVTAILATFARAEAAEQVQPEPVIVVSNTPTDPQKLTWLTDDGRKALTSGLSDLKSGALAAFIFVAAPGGDYWSTQRIAKPGDFANMIEKVRLSLQACEYLRKAPCAIISINGHDAVDANGSYPTQPSLFDHGGPRLFDPERIPFLENTDRSAAAGYASQTGPRVFVVSSDGGWLWRTGKTIFDAIATGYSDCQKTLPGETCILYAVNDRVVFDLSEPQ